MTPVRWLLGLAGIGAISYAVIGAVTSDGLNIPGVVTFLAALVVAHDIILLPIAIGVGALVLRYVPGWARASVQGGLFASAIVSAIAFPFVIRAGASPDNPSKLPLNYGRGLLIVLAVIWAVAIVSALWTRASVNRASLKRASLKRASVEEVGPA